MAKILYLHGSHGGPFGARIDHLEKHGHHVVSRPMLPYPRHSGRLWQWVWTCLDQRWFRASVETARAAFEKDRPDVVVGISMGGAVAMNLGLGDVPQVLVAPGWKGWGIARFGAAHRVGATTVLVHGERDRTVFPRDSRRLLANSLPVDSEKERVARVES